MSKIARNPIAVPDGVTVTVNGQNIKAKGAKGELNVNIHETVSVQMKDDGGKKFVVLAPKSKDASNRTEWGTNWSLVRNILTGVSKGYSKNLEIQGVGLRANVQGKNLVMQLGFSHDVVFPIPEGITIAVDKQTKIAVTGIDKQRVGQVSAEIRGYKPPEPYKGKGIRYEGEFILRKEGKKK